MKRLPAHRWQIAALFVAVVVCALVAGMRSRSDARLKECKTNLKSVATALEIYSTDWAGKYPPSLNQLTPNYLKTIPRCPNSSGDTYREGVEFGLGASYNTQSFVDYYYVSCHGANHVDAGVEPNFPGYPAYSAIHERAP